MSKNEAAVVAGTPVIDVKFKDIRVAVVALNESGLLKEKIKLVGISRDQILKDFMAGMDSIPDDPKTEKFPGPKAALDFFNKVTDLQEAVKKGAVPPAAPVAEKPKKEKTGGAAKPVKKEKKEKTVGAASALAEERKQKREAFLKAVISAGKAGITMAEIKKAVWNPTKASFYAPLKDLIEQGKIKMDGKKMVYVKK
jgi:hypothetical protein